MRRTQRIIVLLFLPGLLQAGARAANDPVDHCVAAIGSIRSYDVTFRKGYLVLDELASTETNRDVFAIGLGRRHEECIGTTNHSVGVLDLRTSRPDSVRCNYLFAYPYYINPVVDAANGHSWSSVMFLTDLLTNRDSTVSRLVASPSEAKLIGFQVDNPSQLNGQYIRLWLDPEHGYMPRKVEEYLRVENRSTPAGLGRIGLAQTILLDEFKQVGENIWVPTKGSAVIVVDGHAMAGCAMEIDLDHSTWNSIKSEELFLAESMSKVNYKKDGWAYDYSSQALADAVMNDKYEKTFKKLAQLENPSKAAKRTILGAIIAFTGVFFIVLIASRRRNLV